MRFGDDPPSLGGDITASDIKYTVEDLRTRYDRSIRDIIRETRTAGDQHDDDGGGGNDVTSALVRLSHALGEASESSARATLPSMTHRDPSTRRASSDAKDEIKSMFDDTFSNVALYHALVGDDQQRRHRTDGSSGEKVDGGDDDGDNDARAFSYLLDQFRRVGGCTLSKCDREELATKRRRIEALCSEFVSNLNEDTTTLTFTEEELDGVEPLTQFQPVVDGEDESKGEEEDEQPPAESSDRGRRLVSLKAPDTMPVLQFATNAATRRAVAEAMANKCAGPNREPFLEAVRLRHECAQLLGYESHAHFMMEGKMARTPERAESFLRDILGRLQDRLKSDLATLNSLKEEEEGLDAGSVQAWDVPYYTRKYKATLGVDEALLRTYFPLDHVKSEILSIYQELLGLEFTRVEDAEVWHPEVECYAVKRGADGPSSTDKSPPLGYFYLDLFPRDGKYAHQCVYPLRPSYRRGDGTRVAPACANIGNLSRGGTDGTTPSLLRFREVETFFHEFGHVMHCVLTRSEHSVQSWAWSAVPWPGGVEQDFLEVPSMMLENFVWRPEVLRRLSRRPCDGSSLPDDVIDRLSQSRYVMKGYGNCRYIAMALFDLIVHGGPGPYEYNGKSLDAFELYNALVEDVSGVPVIPRTTSVTSWYHPMMGYDAGYFGYMWSEAFAADLFSEFERDGVSVINRALGAKYKNEILTPCATKDGDTMLRNFLGREPSLDPFLRRINS